MTDRPAIFSTPMVRSLLADQKTQTRRLATSPLRKCAIGDRLYVREAFARVGSCDPGLLVTFADYPACVPPEYEGVPPASEIKWSPSIHMPRVDSRLTLIVDAVRVEPLQAISEVDARAEGITTEWMIVGTNCNGGRHSEDHGWRYFYDGCPDEGFETAVDAYAGLWSSLHTAEGERWEDNPDVVALSFIVVRENIGLVA